MSHYQFTNRDDAGRILASHLVHYTGRPDVLVLGLPRGGVPVGSAIASVLGCAFDILVVGRLIVPGRDDLTLGVLSPHGELALNVEVIKAFGFSHTVVESLAAEAAEDQAHRDSRFRGDRPKPEVRSRTVIVTDDGLCAGSTLRAALRALRREHPARLVVALPVATPASLDRLADEADEVVTTAQPDRIQTLSSWYADFSLVDDDQLRALLDAHQPPLAA